MGEKRMLVGIPEGKRPFRRPRHGWEGAVEMHHKEMGLEGVDEAWVSTIGRHLGRLMNL
jgi:hypothetical protein